MNMIFVAGVLVAEIIWQAVIGYPPTLEQLKLGISAPTSLWIVRFVGLGLLLAATFLLGRVMNIKSKFYYLLFVFASPLISLLWMSFPIEILKIFIVSLALYLLKLRTKNWAIITALSVIIIIFLNLIIFKENPKIVKILSLELPREEVISRFNTEDNLKPNIYIPTQIKRITYNKYYLAFRDLGNESLNFFDFETIFFQEVHPMDQKAIVMFFWPSIFIFIYSLFLISVKKIKLPGSVGTIILLSFFNFITSSKSSDIRLAILVWPLAAIMSDGINNLITNKNKVLKIGVIILLFLTFYGYLTNYFDRYARKDFWLDNRPLVYKEVYNYIKSDNNKYNKIIIADILYSAKDYCSYFLDDCSNIKYEELDLTKQPVDNNTLYVGLTGSFLGVSPKNEFPQDLNSNIAKLGLKVIQKTHIFNNISNGYGQELLICKK